MNRRQIWTFDNGMRQIRVTGTPEVLFPFFKWAGDMHPSVNLIEVKP